MKIKIKKLNLCKISFGNYLFFIALTFYCANMFLNASLFDYILPSSIFVLMKAVITSLAILKWLLVDKFTVNKIIIYFVILLLTTVVALKNDYGNLVVVVSLILSSHGILFDKIVRALFWNIIVWGIVVIAACEAGYLQDYTYFHTIAGIRRTAHSLGFKYYSTLGYMTMSLTIMWLYMKKKVCSYIEAGGLLVCNYFSYQIQTTTLSFIISICFVISYLFTQKRCLLKLKGTFWYVIATLLPISLCIGTMVVVYLYSEKGFIIDSAFLNTIVSRLNYSVIAVQQYGIHLFGSHIIQYGNTAKVYGNASSSFYIDSGYIYSMIGYGIVFTVILMILYTVLFQYLSKTNNQIGYLWFGAMLVACCVNNFLLNIVYNPLLFFIPAALFDTYKRRKGRKHKNQRGTSCHSQV